MFRKLRLPILNQPKTLVRRSGGHGHDPNDPSQFQPAYARNPMPKKRPSVNYDLVWDDKVAPETVLDYDVPRLSRWTVILRLASGFGVYYLLYLVCKHFAPEPPQVAPRSRVLLDFPIDMQFGVERYDKVQCRKEQAEKKKKKLAES